MLYQNFIIFLLTGKKILTQLMDLTEEEIYKNFQKCIDFLLGLIVDAYQYATIFTSSAKF